MKTTFVVELENGTTFYVKGFGGIKLNECTVRLYTNESLTETISIETNVDVLTVREL